MSNVMQSHTRNEITHRSRRRGAFTLIELLVVVAIIALLAMLMFPSLGNVFGVARSTQCSSRLKEIGKAMKLLEAQEGLGNMKAMFWQDMISPYLGKGRECLICPEYTYQMAMRGQEEEESTIPRAQPLEELVAFKVVKGGSTYYEDMGSGPMVVKLSDKNFKKAKAEGWLGNSNASNYMPRDKYEDGSEETSNPYWLCLEDHGGDQDFKDVMVEVTITGSGYLLKVQCGFTGHQNWIVSNPDHEVIQRTPSNSLPGVLEPIPIAAGGVIASYGMNVMMPELKIPGAIMVMDYHWLIASPTDLWSECPDPENGSIPVFARHKGRANVVFMDGSVRMMDPDDIDPDNVKVAKTYWMP